MKIAVLGGTFNPPHIGHLILAESVRNLLRLDKVIFVPCNRPPHKLKNKLLSGSKRLAMLKSALRANKAFQAADLEIKRGGISYTVDTLKILKKRNPKSKLYLIIGSDLYKNFHTWREPFQIKKISQIVVALREGAIRKKKGFLFVTIPQIGVSSSLVRKKIKNRESIKYLVPTQVESYINKYQLYR